MKTLITALALTLAASAPALAAPFEAQDRDSAATAQQKIAEHNALRDAGKPGVMVSGFTGVSQSGPRLARSFEAQDRDFSAPAFVLIAEQDLQSSDVMVSGFTGINDGVVNNIYEDYNVGNQYTNGR